jgi:ubiquitin C-terminal hydrolase
MPVPSWYRDLPRDKELPHKGIVNVNRNSCWMNSAIQIMIRTESARRLPSVAGKYDSVSEENVDLEKLQYELAGVISKPSVFFDDTIDTFRSTCKLPSRREPFVTSKQHDACEFIGEVLKMEPFYTDAKFYEIDTLHRADTSPLESSIQKQGKAFFWDNVETQDKNRNKFDRSSNIKHVTTITHVNLPLPTMVCGQTLPVSLEKCFDEYTKPEKLDSTNPDDVYFKQISLHRWPQLLVICLKRFGGTKTKNPNYDPKNPDPKIPEFNFTARKIKTPIDVPLYFIQEDQCYRLHGIVRHHGEKISFGHYTSYVYSKIQRKWYHYDDTTVTEYNDYIDFKDTINREQYVIVYEKTAQEECGLVVGTPRPTDPIFSTPKPPSSTKPLPLPSTKPPPLPSTNPPPLPSTIPPPLPSTIPPPLPSTIPPPQGPPITKRAWFCRDSVDPVPCTDLPLQKIPWDRNLPNPRIGDVGLANDCWFNSVFQIMVRTPIAQQIVQSPVVYSDLVLQSIKEEWVKLFTVPNYFEQRGERGCSIFRTRFQDSEKGIRQNKIGVPESDKYFLRYILQIEPFKSDTKYEETVIYIQDSKFLPFYMLKGSGETAYCAFDVKTYIESDSFDVDQAMYVLKIDDPSTFFENVPLTFKNKDKDTYELFGFTIDLNGHFGAVVKNLEDKRWYYFDDRLEKLPTDCVNWTSSDDDTTNTKVMSFASLTDLFACKDIGVNSRKLSKNTDLLDARKTLVYIKTAKQHPHIYEEEFKESELEDVNEDDSTEDDSTEDEENLEEVDG